LADIERATEGVERAGLAVRSVEITASGSIKIETERDTKGSTAAPETTDEREDEAKPAKKRV